MKIFFGFIFGVAFIVNAVSEIREISFYKKNDWDFDLDSGTKLQVYRGDSDEKKDIISNRERVIYAKPIMILVSGMFFVLNIMLF
ncbi:hypothetical protein [Neorhizobium galegae]|uniref:hypothetical protein n=1 Tax=Neorhizobium galegae TaxID=399 RepID=UPI000622534A|nr:hypothetical protein [Neorhizobium galegae]CDZ52839.1 Hypothetical protein NGAL_HAMBI2427_48610 [Neorhizobium galegae bv. orientalis]